MLKESNKSVVKRLNISHQQGIGMAENHVERCSTGLDIRDVYIKTMMKCYYTYG